MRNRLARSCVVSGGVALITVAAGAQTPPKSPEQVNAAALHAMFDVHTFKQASISPDGKRVVWVENLPAPGGAPSSDSAIYVATLEMPERAIRVTAADADTGTSRVHPGPSPDRHHASSKKESRAATGHEEHDLAWAPDSKRIAFLSDAASRGQLQLFVADLSAPSPKPRQLTHFKGFVSAPQWSPDGKTIAVLYTQNATRAAGPLVAETPDEGAIAESFLEQRLTLVDVSSGNTRQISPADMYVYEFDWAPDSSQLAATAAHGNGDDNWYIAELFTIDAASGQIRPILQKPDMQIADPRWSPDGQQMAFIGGLMSDEGVTGGDVFSIPATGGKAKNLTPGMRQSASSLVWAGDSRSVLFAGVADGEAVARRIDLSSGKIERVWSGAEKLTVDAVADISLARDGTTSAVIRQSYAEPPEVWAGPIGQWKQITKLNSGLTPAWGKAISLRWTTEVGSVQGWLVYPANFDASRKYPLVVVVHGGPASAVIPSWPGRWNYYMGLSSEGYFLLFPNPRGSYGEGEAFTAANVKDFGYGDFLDIMGGVDKAIESAPIDPDRLGLTGWSYGGFMTMWGVTKTSRFRAAVAGAGLSDWLSYYGENKIDQWMIPYFGASVYDDPIVYAKSSPINFVKKVSTPTLMVVGDRDGECPAPQSFEFWHALKTLGVQTELVVYPNEGHLFVDPSHSRDVIQRTIAWFNAYLQPAP